MCSPNMHIPPSCDGRNSSSNETFKDDTETSVDKTSVTTPTGAPPPPHHHHSAVVVTVLPPSSDGKPKPTTKPTSSADDSPSYLLSLKTTPGEAKSLFSLSFPIAVMALLMYSRSVVSMLFLGRLGDLPLAAGAIAIAFANITGYSVLSGLSLGMEPLCSQAFGANQPELMSLTLHRAILFLLSTSAPIAVFWLHMSKIMLLLGQDPEIIELAQSYLYLLLPDLVSFSFIHPIRVYLRSQGVTHPLTLAAAFAAAVHVPANIVLVTCLRLGAPGIAAASAGSNAAMLLFLAVHTSTTASSSTTSWNWPSRKCLDGWGPLVRLAAPSCASVCLEWWWYELMIILCGLLPDPKPAVASMGVLIQTTAFLYVFPNSLGLGVSARVGNELGAGCPGGARRSASVALLLAAATGFLSMGFATGVKDRWGRLFTRDDDILRLTASALPIIGLCELGNCPQTVGCGVLRGSARPSAAANINLGAFYIVGMPIGVGLGFGLRLGFCGLWVGLLAAQACCAGLMLYVVGTTDWEEQAQRAQVLTRPAEADGSVELMEEGVTLVGK